MNTNLELYLVTDEAACLGRDFYWVVEEAVKGGVTMVQLREKSLSTRAFIERAKRLKDLLETYNVPLIINDRVDVALAVDADGVHIGQSDMPFQTAHRLLGEGKIIGLSAEKQPDVLEAESWNLSYLAVSPLFATPTKTDTEKPWDIQGLQWARQESRHPLVVIGGVHTGNVREAVRNGANGIAVVSAICSAPSPREAARELRAIVQDSICWPETRHS
ncbi:MAG: thiamine-phosphate diphosphorylase [Dyadobacter sp. 50-39]|uniref:thiamine phosphate synthase n=1 Tax=Dyadobacter sp. 50-39 TaxID=1895756 RepID=UPI00095AC6FF|nr:thiamine phosphate synthase [Dyadobacter sp. 50-39]OJV16761.1 MAG: thiamine-phosphate diphosphorylase [Dyadobacter sp. 50-39]